MTVAVVATSIVFFPAAPLFLFMKGEDITIPKGHEVTAYENGDFKVDAVKFAVKSRSAADQQTAVIQRKGKALTNGGVVTQNTAGFTCELIIATVKTAPGTYMIETDDLIALKKAGVSEPVIAAMESAQGGAQ